VAHDALGRDRRDVLVSLMKALATFEPQREGNGVGEVRVARRE
jgi:hypothetical protein